MLLVYSSLMVCMATCVAASVTFTVARLPSGDQFTTDSCITCDQFDAVCVSDGSDCCRACICRANGTIMAGLASLGLPAGRCLSEPSSDRDVRASGCQIFLQPTSPIFFLNNSRMVERPSFIHYLRAVKESALTALSCMIIGVRRWDAAWRSFPHDSITDFFIRPYSLYQALFFNAASLDSYLGQIVRIEFTCLVDSMSSTYCLIMKMGGQTSYTIVLPTTASPSTASSSPASTTLQTSTTLSSTKASTTVKTLPPSPTIPSTTQTTTARTSTSQTTKATPTTLTATSKPTASPSQVTPRRSQSTTKLVATAMKINKSSPTSTIVGVVVGIIALLALTVSIVLLRRRRSTKPAQKSKTQASNLQTSGTSLPNGIPKMQPSYELDTYEAIYAKETPLYMALEAGRSGRANSAATVPSRPLLQSTTSNESQNQYDMYAPLEQKVNPHSPKKEMVSAYYLDSTYEPLHSDNSASCLPAFDYNALPYAIHDTTAPRGANQNHAFQQGKSTKHVPHYEVEDPEYREVENDGEQTYEAV